MSANWSGRCRVKAKLSTEFLSPENLFGSQKSGRFVVRLRLARSLTLQPTFRGFASVAMTANCVLSAKIKYFREERSSIQEKPAIARNRCYMLPVYKLGLVLFCRLAIFLFRLSIYASWIGININSTRINVSRTGININGC